MAANFRITNSLVSLFQSLQGIEVTVARSRQSRSTYLYLTRNGIDDAMTSIRVSDHVNPALKAWRVSSDTDKAEVTDFEWRTDVDLGFDSRNDFTDWREFAAAICAAIEVPVPVRLAREIKKRRDKAAAEREAFQAAWEAGTEARAKADKIRRIEWARQPAIEATAKRLCAVDGKQFDGKNNRDRRNRYRAIAAQLFPIEA